jgi:hypothetical protein
MPVLEESHTAVHLPDADQEKRFEEYRQMSEEMSRQRREELERGWYRMSLRDLVRGFFKSK